MKKLQRKKIGLILFGENGASSTCCPTSGGSKCCCPNR